jgi:hypothetical protein
MSFRDTLSPEDRRIWDEAEAREQANRAANRAAMDAAGVPQSARRGFTVASCYYNNKIVEITEYPRERRASRWGVFVEMYEGSSSRYCYLIGPRGAVRKIV